MPHLENLHNPQNFDGKIFLLQGHHLKAEAALNFHQLLFSQIVIHLYQHPKQQQSPLGKLFEMEALVES